VSPRLRLALLALVPLVAYASALFSGFVWDDHQSLEHGLLIGSLRNLPALFSHDTMFNSFGAGYAARALVDTYRPLTMATFLVEHALFGLRPALYHLDSVLLHVANVLCAYAVGRRLRLSPNAALAAALVFAVHPAISEAVHWINGRSDPMCLLFFQLALFAWLDRRPVAAALAIFAATLCKETAFLLVPPVALLVGYLPPPRRRLGVELWPWAAGGALGAACRLWALGHAATGPARQLPSVLRRLPPLWLDGLSSLALPAAKMPPSLFQRYQHVSPGWLLASIAVVALLGAAAVFRLRRGHPLGAWALATLCATLAPIALLTVDEGWNGWGRYLYAAAMPCALACAGALVDGVIDGEIGRARPHVRRWATAAFSIGVAALAIETCAGGRDWRDDHAFGAAMVADHPDSAFGWSELAAAEFNAGQTEDALAHARRAIALAPQLNRPWSISGRALLRLGRRGEAYAAARRAVELLPEDNDGHLVVAIGLVEERREAEGARELLEAIRIDPSRPGPWATLREAITKLGRESQLARQVAALAEDPRYAAFADPLRAVSRSPGPAGGGP
jgi:tetratricopeptide (TPR) repeat protein